MVRRQENAKAGDVDLLQPQPRSNEARIASADRDSIDGDYISITIGHANLSRGKAGRKPIVRKLADFDCGAGAGPESGEEYVPPEREVAREILSAACEACEYRERGCYYYPALRAAGLHTAAVSIRAATERNSRAADERR